MFIKILLLLTVVPFVELALLIAIGKAIGFWPTVGIILGTGLIGTGLIRWQGLKIMSHIRADLRAGRIPTDALLGGLITLIAGAFLLTPGLITDLVGLSLLVPGVQHRLRERLKNRIARWFKRGSIRVSGRSFVPPVADAEAEAPDDEPFIDCPSS